MAELSNEKYRIVIVDDHQVVRQGTREMLLAETSFEVVGELTDGIELEAFLKLKNPDVLLLDINLPGKNGLQLLESIRPNFPQMTIILFSAFNDNAYLRKAQNLKANGYLSKTVGEQELNAAILEAIQQQKFVTSDDLATSMEKHAEQGNRPQLTAREQEILIEVAKGDTNADIAKRLCLSVKTVDSHVANVIKKLGVKRRTQLATFAVEEGLL